MSENLKEDILSAINNGNTRCKSTILDRNLKALSSDIHKIYNRLDLLEETQKRLYEEIALLILRR